MDRGGRSGYPPAQARVSTSGFEGNHEVAAFTLEEEPREAFDAWFETLWRQGAP